MKWMRATLLLLGVLAAVTTSIVLYTSRQAQRPIVVTSGSMVNAGDGRTTLRLEYDHRPCDKLTDTIVTEGVTQVTVKLFGEFNDPCMDIAEVGHVDIRLETVLGDRLLVNGNTGATVPVQGS